VTDCLFCKIVTGEVPAQVVRQGERTIAFRDINPKAPTHVLVIPREHYESLAALAAADPQTLAELVGEADAVAREDGVADRGYRIVSNTGREAGQTVFHAHAHVLGGRSMGWPPG
jgi:histidine triad (HIT) family protein